MQPLCLVFYSFCSVCIYQYISLLQIVNFFLSFFRRVLVSGQVLSSLGYRHGKTNDYTLCYAMSPKYGLAVKYVSYCLEDCPPDHGYCQHSILVRPLYPVGEPFVVNEETGASATHIQAVKPGRSEYGCTLLS